MRNSLGNSFADRCDKERIARKLVYTMWRWISKGCSPQETQIPCGDDNKRDKSNDGSELLC